MLETSPRIGVAALVVTTRMHLISLTCLRERQERPSSRIDMLPKIIIKMVRILIKMARKQARLIQLTRALLMTD